MTVSIRKYTDLVLRLRGLDSETIVGIDGFSASGKSTLVEALRNDVPSSVVHIDDFAIPQASPRLELTRSRGRFLASAFLRPAVDLLELSR